MSWIATCSFFAISRNYTPARNIAMQSIKTVSATKYEPTNRESLTYTRRRKEEHLWPFYKVHSPRTVCIALALLDEIAHIQKITTSKSRTATKVERAQIYIIAVIMPYFNVRSMLFFSFSFAFGCICIWFSMYAVASIKSTCYILWFQCLTWNSAISH